MGRAPAVSITLATHGGYAWRLRMVVTHGGYACGGYAWWLRMVATYEGRWQCGLVSADLLAGRRAVSVVGEGGGARSRGSALARAGAALVQQELDDLFDAGIDGGVVGRRAVPQLALGGRVHTLRRDDLSSGSGLRAYCGLGCRRSTVWGRARGRRGAGEGRMRRGGSAAGRLGEARFRRARGTPDEVHQIRDHVEAGLDSVLGLDGVDQVRKPFAACGRARGVRGRGEARVWCAGAHMWLDSSAFGPRNIAVPRVSSG